MVPRHRPRIRGFTLIELLIVVAVIGIVAAIAVPALRFALDRSKQRTTLSDMRSLGGALTQYILDHSYYPDPNLTMSQLHGILANYAGESLATQDRWFHDFGYETDRKNYYSVECFGRDGVNGADITYETRNDFDLDLVYASGSFANSPSK